MSVSSSTGSGVLLEKIRSGVAVTRSELLEELGWSRMTVGKRIDELTQANMIRLRGQQHSTGGRRAEIFEVNSEAGVLLCADIGVSHTRLGVSDLCSHILCELEGDVNVSLGFQHVLTWVRDGFIQLLESQHFQKTAVLGVGIGLPGAVDPQTGALVNPLIMPGWEKGRVADFMADAFGDVVVAVDRDVNIIALGEHWANWSEHETFALVKVGLGVGSALLSGGKPLYGAQGAAGDLGHIRQSGKQLCRCGSRGCLEATASGWALRNQLRSQGYEVKTSSDIVELAKGNDSNILQLISTAGEAIGSAIAHMVGLFNPSVIVIGGNVSQVGSVFLEAIRRTVYASIPAYLVTRLEISSARIGDKAGVLGASLLAQEALFEPNRISLATRSYSTQP